MRQNCPSNGQVLRVHGGGTVTIAVPIPHKGRWMVRPFLLSGRGDAPMTLHLHMGETVIDWSTVPVDTEQPMCVEAGARAADLDEGEATLELGVSSGSAALDRVEIGPH
jgi:hypothetical protein